ncbi:hypothetical protein IH992_19665 [Candidatus Poribacteria bacterium]|nr:hypothetical protein [Candidatus Poribacteria bacterium]
MSNRVTLEQVEQLAAQLLPPEQLKLMAHLCEQLSTTQITESREESARQEQLAQVDAWLAECDTVAESIEGEYDSAEDIRKIRENRANRL